LPARWSRPLPAVVVGLALAPWLLLGRGPSDASHGVLDRPLPRFALTLHRAVTDLDGDGFSPLLGGGDCAPFDRHIHPGAPDVANNGVDENCLLGDGVPEQAPAPRSAEPPQPMSVVLITVDALRPDRLGFYGGPRPITPKLDAWANDSMVFDRAYTSGGWTSVALSSLMRGVWARRLRWTALHETNRLRLVRKGQAATLKTREIVARTFALPLEDERVTLPEILSQRGIETRAVLDDGTTGYFRPQLGAFAGFDSVKLTDRMPRGKRNDEGTTDLAVSALRGLEKQQQFFLWVHYFGVHGPVQKHPEVPELGESTVDKYDHEVAFADREIGRLLDFIGELPNGRNVAVILAADHGEEFDGRSRHHGLTLNEGAIRIPLVLRLPGTAPKRCATPASLVDVSATILSLTGTDVPDHFDGVELPALCREAPERTIFVDTWRFDHRGRTFYDALAAISGDRKVTCDLVESDWGSYVVEGMAERWADDDGAAALRATLERQIERTGLVILND
jgi:hypothetical protein